MKPWEAFQQEILDTLDPDDEFTNRDLAGWLKITTSQASRLIQGYQHAQWSPSSQTRYVLRREGRTRAARWSAGVRTADANGIVGQFGDDVKHRLRRAIAPSLARIAVVNPRARTCIETALGPMLEGFVQMVNGMMTSVGWSDQWEEPQR